MISRVIEAKPEELRDFPRGSGRRFQVQGAPQGNRGAPRRYAREPVARRGHPPRARQPARSASTSRRRSPPQYRELEARLRQSQHLLWYAKQQDAVRTRERCATEIANSRSRWKRCRRTCAPPKTRLEALRAEHYAAGDALHERQGAFYAANAEVTRLEQQLAFARESGDASSPQQVAQLTEAMGAITAQEAALRSDQEAAERGPRSRAGAREQRGGRRGRGPRGACRHSSAALASASRACRRSAAADRAAGAGRPGGRDAARQRAAQRSGLAGAARAPRPRPRGGAHADSDPMREVEEQLAQESAELAGQAGSLPRCNAAVEGAARSAARSGGRMAIATASGWRDLEARPQALAALQAKIGRGKDATAGWPRAQPRAGAPVVAGRSTSSPAGRTRSRRCCANGSRARARPRSTTRSNGPPKGEQLPRRIAAYAPAAPPRRARGRDERCWPRSVSRPESRGPRRLACTACAAATTLARALRERDARRRRDLRHAGRAIWSSAQDVAFFAPDSELHGVLARQRELDELPRRSSAAARRPLAARERARDAVDASSRRRSRPIMPRASPRRRSSAAATTSNSSSCSCVRRRKRPAAPRSQIAARRRDVEARKRGRAGALAAIAAEIADLQSRGHEQIARREAAQPCAQRGRGRRWSEDASACASPSARRRRPDSPSAAAASAWPNSRGGARRSPRRWRSSTRCSRS